MALLHLLHQWACAELVVVTIDHGLRAGSAAEAVQVKKLCQRLNIRHITRCWKGEKPKAALSSLAREARYRLLCHVAGDVGATGIVLGHTLDDQRETILMRASRMGLDGFSAGANEKNNRGLAGIRPKGTYCGPPDFVPVKLFRPLLGIERATLRSFLEGLDAFWIDDPSNMDVKYERARLRRHLDNGLVKMPSKKMIADFSGQVAKVRREYSERCGDFIRAHVRSDRYRVLRINQAAFNAGCEVLMTLLLRILIAETGGGKYLVSPDRAGHFLTRLRDEEHYRFTLGAVVVERRNGEIRLWRENRNLPSIPVGDHPSGCIVWDGRIVFDFADTAVHQQLVIAPLCKQGLALVEGQTGQRLDCSPRAALYSQPALFEGQMPVFVPWAGWCQHGFRPPETRLHAPALELFQLDCDRNLLAAIYNLRQGARRRQ